MNNENKELICGRNAVAEALESGRPINALFVRSGEKNGALLRIIAAAKQSGAPIKEVSVKKLDMMCSGANHQGIAVSCAAREYSTVQDILDEAERKNEQPFVIICDDIEDPHNLGAIIRSAEAAGAHGVIIPKRHGAALTWAVAKASAGAIEHMKIARVPNLNVTVEELKAKNIWIYTADMEGTPWSQTDFSGSVGLIIGNEGKGVSRLLKEKSDFIVSLPMNGKVNSLNASVAAGILMYEVVRSRQLKGE